MFSPVVSRSVLLAFALFQCGSLAPRAAAPALRLPAFFSDHGVLQRDQPIPVWGWSAPGADVRVSFRDMNVHATAERDGRWRVNLPAMAASAVPAELVVRAGGETHTVADVLVGEVWICSGQSNMEWTVAQSADAEREIAVAQFPAIRHFRTARAPSATPRDDVAGAWKPAVPGSVGAFSGVGYFFARDVHRALGGVPVGLINNSWGGKMIEVFLSPAAIARTPHGSAISQRWGTERDELTARIPVYPNLLAEWNVARTAALAAGATFDRPKPTDPQTVRDQHRPGCAFNSLVHPLVPYAIRGVLWYQGEHNATRAHEYRSLLGAMIADWREKFQQGDFPFYFVQLANYAAPTDRSRVAWAELREAQRQTLTVPNTGMAVTIDIGAADDTHPRNKQDVGARLARLANAKTYGLGGEWSGPMLRAATRDGDTLHLEFDHVVDGLVAKRDPLPGFELAGRDGVFRAAQGTLRGGRVVVRAAGVAGPVAVRYGWANAPEAALFNSAGLPAGPFRHSLP